MKEVILAIETSCDDTSAAIAIDGIVKSNIIISQGIHSKHGGVVPEISSREHLKNIILVIKEALRSAKIEKNDLNAISFTVGPGLLGSLLVGCSFAKSLSFALNIPLIGVDHMKAHVLSNFIDEPIPNFPFICLTVSGGHTQLVLVKDFLNMDIIGETLDDAVGEAFDKSAKILGIEYPGGPIIDKISKNGDPLKYKFSKPRISDLNFSFSGIKTSILYFVKSEMEKDPMFVEKNLNDIAASIQYSLVEILKEKLIKAANKYKISNIAIAGGVSANSLLRKEIDKLKSIYNWKTFIPKIEYCTDNAAMIAIAAHYYIKEKMFDDINICPNPRLNF
tara:strand:- start:2841 stop:3845 length:1005 start_codon:yes stop_codon:yes gene_type:complete